MFLKIMRSAVFLKDISFSSSIQHHLPASASGVSMRFVLCLLVFPLLWVAQATSISAQEPDLVPGPSQQRGPYRIILRLPVDGLVANEEQQIEIRILDTSNNDPVLGPPPVIRALIKSSISMPAMPDMPKAEEIAHPEGVPGDYGLHPTFAHGGDYLLQLHITPPRSEAFSVGFPLQVTDEIPRRQMRPKPYQVELKHQPRKIRAGVAARLQLLVWANRELRDDDGRPNGKRRMEQVKIFETVHEKQMHLILARRDLGFFAHTHPQPQSDGSFVMSGFTFPTEGEYQLFVEVAPQGAGSQILRASLKVDGEKHEAFTLSAVRPVPERVVAGVRVSIADNKPLPAKRTSGFTVTFKDANNSAPIDNLQPYLGAFGHLLMIHEDGRTYVHAHPEPRQGQNNKEGRLTFLARPPKPGLFRAWIEFQRNGKVEQTDFIIEVQEANGAHR
jgi:hypothetical protein